MPSPFPGMNPYLEQDDVWHDFHEKIIPAIAERLVAQVRPKYIVKIDEHIYVHESEERPYARFWPIALQDLLPTIPVPLAAADGNAHLDLQSVLHQVYDASGYEDYIYTGSPEPSLSPQDQAWADQLIPRMS